MECLTNSVFNGSYVGIEFENILKFVSPFEDMNSTELVKLLESSDI